MTHAASSQGFSASCRQSCSTRRQATEFASRQRSTTKSVLSPAGIWLNAHAKLQDLCRHLRNLSWLNGRQNGSKVSWRAIVFAYCLLFADPAKSQQQASCHQSATTVIYSTVEEFEAACAAVLHVANHLGRPIAPNAARVSIVFADQSPEPALRHASAHGCFDASRSLIVDYRATATKPWGLDWS